MNGKNLEYKLKSANSWTPTGYISFTYHDPAVTSGDPWKSLDTNKSVTLKSSIYHYYPTTLTATNDMNAMTGIARTSAEYKMLFTNSSTGADKANSGSEENIYYWLGTPCVVADPRYSACFGLRIVRAGDVYCDYMYISSGTPYAPCFGVRPVVSLEQEVRLKDSGTQKDGCKLYNMEAK